MQHAARLLFAVPALVLAAAGVVTGAAEAADFAVSNGPAQELLPALAHDPGNDRFLATWSDDRNQRASRLDVYGRILAADGSPVSADIAVSRAKGGQAFSAVAFDPLRKRYLVVWTDWRDATTTDSDIYGQFVTAAGALEGRNFPIARLRVSQKFPAVAFDPAASRFLVAWTDRRDAGLERIYARFLDSDGRFLGSAFPLVEQGGSRDGPSVVLDSKRNRFLVVWKDSQMCEIYAAFVDDRRTPRRTRIVITAEKNGCRRPSLYAAAFAPDEDVFLVAWASKRNYAERRLDVYGALIDGRSGRLKGPAFPVAAEKYSQESAAVSYDPNGKRFLIVWQDRRRDRRAANMDIYGRFVTPRGKMSEELLVSDRQVPGVKRHPAVAFSPKSDVFLMLWEDGRNAEAVGRQIYGRVPPRPRP